MTDAFEFYERPESDELYLLAGWRQWADAGGMSSALPQYLIKRTDARTIGQISSAGFYLFQFPGTHDLIRPVVKLNEGYPESLEHHRNDFYHSKENLNNALIFIGDEPHLNIEAYADAFLSAAQSLGVRRIVVFGGVYGELPYEKERMVSCIYSLKPMKEEMAGLAVNLSNYQGGASIGSYLCRKAADREIEYVALYAFVPTYDLSNFAQSGSSIRLEHDFTAWLGVMRRVNFMLNLSFDLTDLERKSRKLKSFIDAKVEELEQSAAQLGVRAYLNKLSESFEELPFNPLDDVWEEELRRLFDKFDAPDASAGEKPDPRST